MESTSSGYAGVAVPMPTLPAKYALPVVVAPPDMVSPPVCVPLPMVDDASAYKPLVKPMRVEVALAAEPKAEVGLKSVSTFVPAAVKHVPFIA